MRKTFLIFKNNVPSFLPSSLLSLPPVFEEKLTYMQTFF
jgi:hypothetical protein